MSTKRKAYNLLLPIVVYAAAGLTVAAMLLADRFTVIGMGKDFATNVGVNYQGLMALGVLLVSMCQCCRPRLPEIGTAYFRLWTLTAAEVEVTPASILKRSRM